MSRFNAKLYNVTMSKQHRWWRIMLQALIILHYLILLWVSFSVVCSCHALCINKYISMPSSNVFVKRIYVYIKCVDISISRIGTTWPSQAAVIVYIFFCTFGIFFLNLDLTKVMLTSVRKQMIFQILNHNHSTNTDKQKTKREHAKPYTITAKSQKTASI